MTVAAVRSAAMEALMQRADRARAQAIANRDVLEQVLLRTRAFDVGSDSRPPPPATHDECQARVRELEETVDGLTKRLESQAPIEQAKGIIMAQTRCGPDQAFEILRRASQRSNNKLRVLAAELVARTAQGGPAR